MVLDKSVVLTGGYGGIGFEAARTIAQAQAGWHIIIAGRNIAAAQAAATRLNGEFGADVASARQLDLSALAKVSTFAAELANELRAAKLPPLAGLICNAGTQTLARRPEFTTDGFEQTFAVNHLGHFALVQHLLPLLQTEARIIFTSSGTHDPDTQAGRMNKPAPIDAKALARPDADAKNLSGMQRYATSKLANLMTAFEMARRIDRSITVNAYDPGAVPTTGLVRSYPVWMRWLLSPRLLRLLGVKTETEKSAGTGLGRLLTDPALIGVTGKYFGPRGEAVASAYSQDRAVAQALYDDSAALIAQ